jgi:hypothetical protein
VLTGAELGAPGIPVTIATVTIATVAVASDVA